MILGLDPSTRIIGYAFYDELSSKIELGHIKLQSDILQERYKEAAEQIKLLIKEKKPNKIGIETSFFGKNIGVAIKLAVVRGIITGLVYTMTKARLFEVTPAEERKALGLDIRKADKQEVHKALEWQFKLLRDMKATDDELDALAVALATNIKLKETKYVEDYHRKRI